MIYYIILDHKYIESKGKEGDGEDSGDEEDEIRGNTIANVTAPDRDSLVRTTSINNDRTDRNSLHLGKPKDLVGIINHEKLQQKEQAAKAAEQIERHQIHDKNISTGAKVKSSFH